MKRKKLTAALLCCALAVAAALALAGCGSDAAESYTPGEGEHYFRSNDVWRVLTLESGEPEHEEHVPLDMIVQAKGDGAVTFRFAESFAENSLFFSWADMPVLENVSDAFTDTRINIVGREGAEAVYDLLGIGGYQLRAGDYPYDCSESRLFTYNEADRSASVTATIDLSRFGGTVTVGHVAEMDIYTVNYEDRAVSDGSVQASGSFPVYVLRSSMVSVFGWTAE